MFDTGYWTAFHLRGIPIRFHWSVPAGALFVSGLTIRPGVWVGFLALVLIHELGHAVLVRRQGLNVIAVDVHGLGGVCRYSGFRVTPVQRSIIAWGGVLGQALLAGVGFGLAAYSPLLGSPFVAQLISVFTWFNLFLIVLNLLPFPPFDGAEAWQLFRHLRPARGPRPSGGGGGQGEKVTDLLKRAEERKRRREDLH